MKIEKYKDNGGGVLLLVLLVVIIMSVLGGGLLKLANHDAIETVGVKVRAQAFWLAEAGLQEFMAVVAEPVNRTRLDYVGEGLIGAGVLGGSIPDRGTYTVDIAEDSDNSGRVIKEYTITSTGRTTGGEEASVSIHAMTETFANYIYATDAEETPDGHNISFRNDDVIGKEGLDDLADNGVMFSNDKFNINGSPDLWAEVRSAANGVNYNDRRDERVGDPDVFHNGLELGAIPLDFGAHNFEGIKAAAGKKLSGNYAIEFKGTTYDLVNLDTGIVTTNNFISDINLAVNRRIIYVDGNVEVKGNVGTAVSVAAAGALYITDDIIYTSSLGQPDHSDWSSGFQPAEGEVLGLFSESKIEISRQLVEGANEEINIHATILVTNKGNGGFGAAGYPGYRTPYGDINLYGSLSQYRRGVVGYTSGNGYRKNYAYDPRLRETPPPGTPYSIFLISEWRQL